MATASTTAARKRPLGAGQKLAVLVIPWLFLAVFLTLYTLLLWPNMMHGHVLAIIAGILGGMAFISFAIAAVTFSRDVLTNQYP